MKIKKTENRGGKRPGAGRPAKLPAEYSENFKADLLKALDKKAKETNVTIFDLFAAKIYSKKTPDQTFGTLFRIFTEIMVVRESKRTVDINETGKVIFLPQIKNDMALPTVEAEIITHSNET